MIYVKEVYASNNNDLQEKLNDLIAYGGRIISVESKSDDCYLVITNL